MVRNLALIIERILEKIPNHKKWEDLKTTLEDNRTSVICAAPESMRMWWHEVAWALEDYIGEPTEDWMKEIIEIFSGRKEV